MFQLIARSKLLASRWYTMTCMILMILAVVAMMTEPTEAAAKRGGVLRMAINTDLTQMDIHQTAVAIDTAILGPVYETLLSYDEKANIKPFLAESYSYSNDGLLLTLNLRKGVKFHNGEEMKAEDVKFSLDRVRDPKLPGYHTKNLQPLTEVKITGPYQVQLVLSSRMSNLLNYLATSTGIIAMMSKKDLEANGNKVIKPMGTGPWKWAQYVKDSKVVFERFEGYSSPEGPVDGMLGKRNQYFDRMEMHILKEAAPRIMALDKGDLDFVAGLPFNMIDDLKKRKDITVYSGLSPEANWSVFYLNFNNPIIADVNFRKALAHALDLKEITNASVWGHGIPSFSIYSPKLPGYDPNFEKMAPAYDPAKAKELLKKTNYKGEKLRLLTSKVTSNMFDQAVAAQAMWATVGINTEIVVVDWATHLAKWRQPDFDICSFGMIGRLTPIDQTIYLDSKENFYGYKNEKIDNLRNQMKNTIDQGEMNRLFSEINKITMEEIPWIIIYYINNNIAFKNYLKGFTDFDLWRGRPYNWYFEK